MGEKQAIWYLCAQCALELRQTLRLEALTPSDHQEKKPCTMCHIKCYGETYRVRFKTKGE